MGLELSGLTHGDTRLLLHWIAGGPFEQTSRENRGRDQVKEGYAGPHEGASEVLIAENRTFGSLVRSEIERVNNRVAEGEICGEEVARDGGEKKIEKDRPARPD